MAKGANIRYNIPWFNPLAGFSPICDTALVQTEHWALTMEAQIPDKNRKHNIITNFFIYCSKVTKQNAHLTCCLIKYFFENIAVSTTCFYFVAK